MKNNFFIVGIGGSAGSLPAIIEFFRCIPVNTGAAFVVVCHLQRDRRSYLDQIFSMRTHLPVIRVEQHTVLSPGHIYLLVEGTYLTCEHNILRVQPREEGFNNRAVDIFLNSLAGDAGSSGIAIIFSGGGADGLKGAKALYQVKGTVLVQDPATAKAEGMPCSVIKYYHPLKVLDPSQLAKELLVILRHEPGYTAKPSSAEKANRAEF